MCEELKNLKVEPILLRKYTHDENLGPMKGEKTDEDL